MIAVLALGVALAAGPPSVSVRGAPTAEEVGTAVFTIRLSRPASGTVSVRFATADGSARAGRDYTARSGRVRFKRGQRTQVVRVPVLDDAEPEAQETFFLRLTGVGARATASIAASDLPTPFTLKAEMTGAKYVPQPGHPTGSGTAVLVIDAEREQVSYTIAVSGMEVGESGLCRADAGAPAVAVARFDFPPQTSGTARVELATILEMFRTPERFCVLARRDQGSGGIRGQLEREGY